jgi:hypothetical protein
MVYPIVLRVEAPFCYLAPCRSVALATAAEDHAPFLSFLPSAELRLQRHGDKGRLLKGRRVLLRMCPADPEKFKLPLPLMRINAKQPSREDPFKESS